MFEIGRQSGKSDAEVLLDLVEQARPGDILDYDLLSQTLSDGTSREYSRQDVQGSVGRAERKLAVSASRALLNVRNVGYKVALADEHQTIAGRKRDRSNKLLKRGLVTLQHVRWDEMDDNSRRAHEGQLMVMSALHQAVTGIEQRLNRVEDAIRSSRSTSE